MVVTPLLHPDDFFRDTIEPAAYGPAAAIVLAHGLLTALVLLLFAEAILPGLIDRLATADLTLAELYPDEVLSDPFALERDVPALFTLRWFWYGVAFGSVVILGLGIWLAVATLLYFVSILFGGRGPFDRLLIYTGWGYLPALLLTGVYGIELVVAVLFLGPGAYWETFLLTDFLYPYLSVFVLLWIGYIWIFAVKHARELPLSKAIATTAVPVGIYALLELLLWFA